MLVISIILIITTFLLMEATAWFTHKYIMHGLLWCWHKSHHTHHQSPLEKNDLFAVVFSVFTIAVFLIGIKVSNLWYLIPIGIGISSYGLFYFIFHDIVVHRRVKVNINVKKGYLKRIMNAHYVHHKVHTKDGAKAFGFLYAPKKYGKEGLLS